MKALLIHGGGPTAVLNASLAGLAQEWRRLKAGILLGARFGMQGLLKGDFIDLSGQPDDILKSVAFAAGSALGSSRVNFEDNAAQTALAGFDVVFLNGGNGTMRAARRLNQWVPAVGIPKTIDNDLHGTDFTPGYPSCARFFAHAARDIGEDNTSLPSPVLILETLGRDTGWVVGATALARHRDCDPPHLVYFPERPVSLDQVCSDVENTVRRWGRCVIAVCEGQRDETGQVYGASMQLGRDGAPVLPANLGHTLAQLIQARTGIRSRSAQPSLLGRSNPNFVSTMDHDAAKRCGQFAARLALDGARGVMVTVQQTTVPLEDVAGRLRPLPPDWIGAPAFLDYLRPLVGPIDPIPRLR